MTMQIKDAMDSIDQELRKIGKHSSEYNHESHDYRLGSEVYRLGYANGLLKAKLLIQQLLTRPMI